MMKVTKLLLALMMTALFSSTAMAVDVNISGAVSGIYTLNGMDITSDGTIYLDISDGGTCTPGSAVVNPTTISRTITEGGTASSQTVNVRDNCNNSLDYDADTLGGAWISAPVSGTGTMNVTFNTSALSAGTYTGTINVTPAGYSQQTVNVNLTVNPDGGGGDPPGTVLLSNNVAIFDIAIASYETKYFKFIIQPWQEAAFVQITSDGNWRGQCDMMVSYGLPEPNKDDYDKGVSYSLAGPPLWAAINSQHSNENLTMYYLQPGTYYVMVHNYSNEDGGFAIAYSAFAY